MHLPIRKLGAKHRFRSRRFIRRIDPVKPVVPAIVDSDEALPTALPQGVALGLCPLCGMPNGITARACWRCEAELSTPAGFRAEVEQRSGARSPDGLEAAPGTDLERAQDVAVGAPSGHVPTATALSDPVGPVALADLPRISAVRSGYPTLTHVVQTGRPLTTLPAFSPMEERDKRTALVPVAAAVLAILVAGAYLYARKSPGIEGSWTLTVGNRQNEPAVAPEAISPANSDRTLSPSTTIGLIQAAPPNGNEARAAAARVGSVKPAASADLNAMPLPGSRANDARADVTPSSMTPQANAANLTAAQRGKVRSAPKSSNAAVAAQSPGTLLPPRRAPEARVPCTAAVVALGLCEAPSVPSKE